MPIQAICPACGATWADNDPACGSCGFVKPPSPASEELIASWVDKPTHSGSPPDARDAVCVACGYEGPMVPARDGGRGLCPACDSLWQDRLSVVKRLTCPDCGHILLLTEVDRGRTIICPGCRNLLGCLLDREGGRRPGPARLIPIVVLAASLALGYNIASDLGGRPDPDRVVRRASVLVMPITWTLVALRAIGPRPRRRRRFAPPGLAACVAVSAASLLNGLCAVAIAAPKRSTAYDVFTAAVLRVVEPLPLAAAVFGVWAVLFFDRRWRPEPTWIDRLGRFLGLYWLAAGLILPLIRLFL